MDASNTKITIINKALSHLKVRTITSLDENCEQARKANLFYDCTRKSALRACDWRFATVKPVLNLLGDVNTALANPTDLSKQDFIPQWLFTYAYPANCVRLRKVFNAQVFIDINPYNDRSAYDYSSKIAKFEIARSPRTNLLAIACNLEAASAEYTFDITDESQFDDMFQDAFAWLLAEDLAMPLSADMELQGWISSQAKKSFDEAKRKNGGEGTEMAPRQSNYEAARNGGDLPL